MDEDFDASGDTGLTANEAVAFECEHHLVNRGWADLEVTLHIDFGRSAAEHARVGIDEGQILALLFGEAFRAAGSSGA